MAVLIPLVLVLVYLAYKFFSKAQEDKQNNDYQTSMTLTKHRSLEDEPGTYPTPKETDVD